jgi:hypothetical protein
MVEFLLALFIFVTIFIDTLSLVLKSTGEDIELAKVYAVAQALTYVTRFSLFFILPLIGMILDGVLEFEIKLCIIFLSAFLLLHSVLFYMRWKVVVSNSGKLVELFNKSLSMFFYFAIFKLMFSKRKDNEISLLDRHSNNIKPLFALSHFFLTLIFPIVLLLGDVFVEYRGILMGATSVYTGIFSIYITFFIERKIPYLSSDERVEYIMSLVYTKLIAILSSCFFLVIIVGVK